nr:unnamed protein product [Callosobruchus analis]
MCPNYFAFFQTALYKFLWEASPVCSKCAAIKSFLSLELFYKWDT